MRRSQRKIILSLFLLSLCFGLTFPFALRAETTIPAEFHFARTLQSGSHGEDVRYLQVLLNRDAETRVNAPGLLGGAGNETDFFGGATRRAVIAFQKKYANEVLLPAKLLAGTGTVGPLTLAKLILLLELSRTDMLRAQNASVIPPLSLPGGEATGTASTIIKPTFSFDEVNVKTREALVNILCTTKRGGFLNPISGSGVFIDPRGVILTNAHVGQYFLLKEYLKHDFVDCTIRTGEPARNSYKATLLYLSPLWIHENARKISEDTPTGTGENDFALLLIERTTSAGRVLPTVFPSLPMDFKSDTLRTPRDVLAAGYPAGLLSGISIERDLYPTSSVVRTGTVYSFGGNTPDIFSVGGSVIAQEGSSGGAVVSSEGDLIGLIVTSSTGKTTGERNLNVLTMSHLEWSLKSDTGSGFSTLFSGDLVSRAKSFTTDVAPKLKQALFDVLTKE